MDKWALQRMNIPERFWEATFDKVPDNLKTPIQRYCTKIDSLIQRGVGFFIHGPCGVGKSSAAAVLLKAGWEREKRGYYTTVKELRHAMREELTFDGSESIFSRCRDVEILVLDDLALDDFKNFVLGIGDIEHLIATRAMRSKTTILTTRLTPDTFRQEYPALLQTMQGSFVSVACNGPNMNVEAAARLRLELGVR